MSEQQKFRQMRREAAEAALRLEQARRDLKLREETVRTVLARLREACPHHTAAEIRYEWEEPIGGDCSKFRAAGRRYCLACGTDEPASTYSLDAGRYHYRYSRLEKSEVVRREMCHDSATYTAALAIFIERLHGLARFDEFDAKGVWHGAKQDDDHIRKGVD